LAARTAPLRAPSRRASAGAPRRRSSRSPACQVEPSRRIPAHRVPPAALSVYLAASNTPQPVTTIETSWSIPMVAGQERIICTGTYRKKCNSASSRPMLPAVASTPVAQWRTAGPVGTECLIRDLTSSIIMFRFVLVRDFRLHYLYPARLEKSTPGIDGCGRIDDETPGSP